MTGETFACWYFPRTPRRCPRSARPLRLARRRRTAGSLAPPLLWPTRMSRRSSCTR